MMGGRDRQKGDKGIGKPCRRGLSSMIELKDYKVIKTTTVEYNYFLRVIDALLLAILKRDVWCVFGHKRGTCPAPGY